MPSMTLLVYALAVLGLIGLPFSHASIVKLPRSTTTPKDIVPPIYAQDHPNSDSAFAFSGLSRPQIPPPRSLPQFDQDAFFNQIQNKVSEVGVRSQDELDHAHDGARHPPPSSSKGQSTFGHRRLASPGYSQVFNGTGRTSRDRDASIDGSGYLTYKVVGNETYNVDACLEVCDSIPNCAFVNLFYEYNNSQLDFIFSEKSNLKCVAYNTVHTAQAKTNFGGQQSIPPPAEKTYVQQSTGYAKTGVWDPPTPDQYELVFGPEDGYVGGEGSLSTVLLDSYDVEACAAECTKLPPSSNGICQFFNINQVSEGGDAVMSSCLLYSIPKTKGDLSTSTSPSSSSTNLNTTFSFSRGYRRTSALPDGGFEAYQSCDPSSPSSPPSPPTTFCFTFSTPTWTCTSPTPGSFDDCSLIHFSPYAHTGTTSTLLGSLTNSDSHSGVLTTSPPTLNSTSPNSLYHLGFWHYGGYAGPVLEEGAWVSVRWNEKEVMKVVLGYAGGEWLYLWTVVMAQGEGEGRDGVVVEGGKAPAWSFLDDVVLFRM